MELTGIDKIDGGLRVNIKDKKKNRTGIRLLGATDHSTRNLTNQLCLLYIILKRVRY